MWDSGSVFSGSVIQFSVIQFSVMKGRLTSGFNERLFWGRIPEIRGLAPY